jgi:hypothetical protein
VGDLVWSCVPRCWPESTVVILGGGASLVVEDVDAVRGRARVIAINDAHRLAPWADVLYAADARWWRYYQGVPTFAGLKYALQVEAAIWPGVQVLRNTGECGLEPDPSGLRTGRNSGYQAMNLAVHLGARRMVLLGYDMGRQAGQPTHWFGEHPVLIRSASPFHTFLHHFATIVEPLQQLGIEVINCSRWSRLDVFPRRPLVDVLS